MNKRSQLSAYVSSAGVLVFSLGLLAAAPVSAATSTGCVAIAPGVSESLVLPSGGSLRVNGFNQYRGASQVIVYTPAFGASTETNQWGAEMTVVNGVVTAIDNGPVSGHGNSPIPADGYVISAQGGSNYTDVKDILQFKVGEAVHISLAPPPYTAQINLSAPPNPTAANNPAGAPYPALRGPNQMILYTPAWGKRTGTNPWGSEATVVNGVVTHIGGGDSLIPANGYVLSGDGTSQTWILHHLIVGAKVAVKQTAAGSYQVTGTITAHAFTRQADASQANAEAAVAAAKSQLYQIPSSSVSDALSQLQGQVAQAQSALAAGNVCSLINSSGQAYATGRDIQTLLVPSSPAEDRGVWFSANPGSVTFPPTPTGIEQAVSTLVSGHMNSLELGVPRLAASDPSYQGRDMVTNFVYTAQQQGLQVFSSFNVLLGNPTILKAHPSWAMIGYQGQTQSPLSGFRWLDPAIPAVRQYLVNAIKQRVLSLHPNGVVLDYIRYPRADVNYQSSFSYNAYDIAAFEHLTGVNPQTITPTSNAAAWQAWTNWRQAQVSRLVQDIHRMLAAVAPHTPLFAAVGASLSNDQTHRLENLQLWTQRGWINGFFPEIYQFAGVIEAAVNTAPFVSMAGKSLVSPILSPELARGANALAGQVGGVKTDQVSGEQFFANYGMTGPMYRALLAGPYRRNAVDPLTSPLAAVAALDHRVQSNVGALYEPAGLSTAAATVIASRLFAIDHLVTKSQPEVASAQQQVSALQRWIQTSRTGDGGIPGMVATQLMAHLRLDQQWLTYWSTLPANAGQH